MSTGVGPNATIRPATAEDVTAVAALEERCLGRDAWSFGLVQEGIVGALPTIDYRVAELDGAIVGYAAASLVPDVAELQRIAVASGQRRRGVAGALFGSVCDRVRSVGAERILLEVREDNTPAREFYAAEGFVEVHRRPRYYRDGTTALVLSLDLGASTARPTSA